MDKYDVVLLTDCVFSASLAVDLVGTILNHMEEKATVICCHEIRDEVFINLWFHIELEYNSFLFINRKRMQRFFWSFRNILIGKKHLKVN